MAVANQFDAIQSSPVEDETVLDGSGAPSAVSAYGRTMLAGLVLVPAFAWAYWPTLRNLTVAWEREPDYSHGWLVAPLALLILWVRHNRFPGISQGVAWLGLGDARETMGPDPENERRRTDRRPAMRVVRLPLPRHRQVAKGGPIGQARPACGSTVGRGLRADGASLRTIQDLGVHREHRTG